MTAERDIWFDPPWDTPLDGDVVLRAVPADGTMTGVFLDAAAKAARERGLEPKTARARYLPFQRYPLREHCALLIEVARLLFPDEPLRSGLRRLGRGAPHALMQSTLGRVVLASADGPFEKIGAMAKSYAMHMRPSSLEAEAYGTKGAIVHASDVYTFLDSHNVGVFEGVMRHAGVTGTVKLRPFSRTAADLLCTWD